MAFIEKYLWRITPVKEGDRGGGGRLGFTNLSLSVVVGVEGFSLAGGL